MWMLYICMYILSVCVVTHLEYHCIFVVAGYEYVAC